ncbi:hypothetical protein [Aeromonas salmonicida]|uniref:hypothetical protein n=1 Tax=Aeromonas salmonicida TaxID=645 RepID=UPI00259EC016|nr:hypothetical protein [Aeromonas salmonicida]MDM5112952.1 hypothetical protein [Aeromonas salmonicida]
MYTLAEAMQHLFGIKLADHPKLKDKLYSLTRNGLIRIQSEPSVQRTKKYLAESELTTLFNATLLLAIFPDPARVKATFEAVDERQKVAKLANLVVMNRQSLLEFVYLNANAATFVQQLASDINLRLNRLSNPFEQLPQILLDGDVSLLGSNVARSASLAKADPMLRCYLGRELDAAATHASAILMEPTQYPSELVDLARHIQAEYQSAKEFSATIDLLFGKAF